VKQEAVADQFTKRCELFCAFVQELNESDIPYCILGAYEQYPQHIGSDVDFMVAPSDMERLAGVLERVASKTGSKLVQALRHETSACYFVLAATGMNGQTVLFHPDASGDYRRNGRVWLRAGDLLSRRRLHPNGFYIPSAEDAFIYYLIKRIDTLNVSEVHIQRLRALHQEAPQRCAELIREHWNEDWATKIHKAIGVTDVTFFEEQCRTLRHQLHAGARAESLIQRTRQSCSEVLRRVRRILHPTGLFVVVLGPDGSGKSSVMAKAIPEVEGAFRRTARYHLKPNVLRFRRSTSVNVTDPHAKAPRGALVSMLKLAYMAADYWIGYLVTLRPQLVRSTLIVFDRYYHDVLVDPRRYRYGGPEWYARALARVLPKPDLWILLDAPAEVLQSRKQEVPFAESARQRDRYLDVATNLPNAVIIDASENIQNVVARVSAAVVSGLEERMSSRVEARSEVATATS
jgi:thymidylate kinase